MAWQIFAHVRSGVSGRAILLKGGRVAELAF